MTVRFIKYYGIYKPGDTTDAIEGGVADVLFNRKILEYVEQSAEAAAPSLANPSSSPVGERPTRMKRHK